MNLALTQLPEVSDALAIERVLPANEQDYDVLLDYQRQAQASGLAQL